MKRSSKNSRHLRLDYHQLENRLPLDGAMGTVGGTVGGAVILPELGTWEATIGWFDDSGTEEIEYDDQGRQISVTYTSHVISETPWQSINRTFYHDDGRINYSVFEHDLGADGVLEYRIKTTHVYNDELELTEYFFEHDFDADGVIDETFSQLVDFSVTDCFELPPECGVLPPDGNLLPPGGTEHLDFGITFEPIFEYQYDDQGRVVMERITVPAPDSSPFSVTTSYTAYLADGRMESLIVEMDYLNSDGELGADGVIDSRSVSTHVYNDLLELVEYRFELDENADGTVDVSYSIPADQFGWITLPELSQTGLVRLEGVDPGEPQPLVGELIEITNAVSYEVDSNHSPWTFIPPFEVQATTASALMMTRNDNRSIERMDSEFANQERAFESAAEPAAESAVKWFENFDNVLAEGQTVDKPAKDRTFELLDEHFSKGYLVQSLWFGMLKDELW